MAPRLRIQKLRHDDPAAAFTSEDLRRTPQERFAAAEELIQLAFRMRGGDDRVHKHTTRVVRRRS